MIQMSRRTIEDINIISEMNTSNRLLAETEDKEALESTGRTNEQYNLQPRPQNRVKSTMAQNNKQSISLAKTNKHSMLTQLNIKDGLNAYGNKEDEAILKEVQQLHKQQARMLQSRHEMSYHKRKKELRYLIFP